MPPGAVVKRKFPQCSEQEGHKKKAKTKSGESSKKGGEVAQSRKLMKRQEKAQVKKKWQVQENNQKCQRHQSDWIQLCPASARANFAQGNPLSGPQKIKVPVYKNVFRRSEWWSSGQGRSHRGLVAHGPHQTRAPETFLF